MQLSNGTTKVATNGHDTTAQNPEVFEVTGTIKWFNTTKGFGFIATDNDHPDIFFHASDLHAGGFEVMFEGARVRCEVHNGPKGNCVRRFLELDNSTAPSPASLPHRTHEVVAAESGWQPARVKWFEKSLGYGFLIIGHRTPDIFVHSETMRRYGLIGLRAGQIVSVRYGRGSRGLIAVELKLGK